jgi:hypothetical protein
MRDVASESLGCHYRTVSYNSINKGYTLGSALPALLLQEVFSLSERTLEHVVRWRGGGRDGDGDKHLNCLCNGSPGFRTPQVQISC